MKISELKKIIDLFNKINPDIAVCFSAENGSVFGEAEKSNIILYGDTKIDWQKNIGNPEILADARELIFDIDSE